MDHQTFDRLTRLFSATGSRRAAWRALLGAAFLGTTTRSAVAAPCHDRKHYCGDDCCPGKCFAEVCTGHQLCCTAANRLIICGNQCCMAVDASGKPIVDPCTDCTAPPAPPCEDEPEFISGSYRRR